MVYHVGMLLTRCCQQRDCLYQVASCSSAKFMVHVVYYQRQGKTSNWMDFSVCFDTSRMLAQYRNHYLGCSGRGTPTAIHWFQNFGSVNMIGVESIRIRCTSGECEFNSYSNRIKCEKAFIIKFMKNCKFGETRIQIIAVPITKDALYCTTAKHCTIAPIAPDGWSLSEDGGK